MAIIALVLGVIFQILLTILNGFTLLYGVIKTTVYKPIRAAFR